MNYFNGKCPSALRYAVLPFPKVPIDFNLQLAFLYDITYWNRWPRREYSRGRNLDDIPSISDDGDWRNVRWHWRTSPLIQVCEVVAESVPLERGSLGF